MVSADGTAAYRDEDGIAHGAADRARRDTGLMLRHRRALVRHLAGGSGAVEPDPLAAARGHVVLPPAVPPALLGSLTAHPADIAIGLLPQLLREVAQDGIVALTAETPLPVPALRATGWRYAHYVQFPIHGTHLTEAAFAGRRLGVLRDGSGPGVHLYIFRRAQEPPPLPTGIFQSAATLRRAYPPPAAPLPGRPPARAAAPAAQTADNGAASLAGRLRALEAENLALLVRLAAVEHNEPATPDGAAIAVPAPGRAVHAWRHARLPAGTPPSADPYDRRVDDPVIDEARAGEAFLAEFGLLGAAPDFGRAVAALAVRAARLAPASGPPDVSIVIPVYGQLAYTLNCLDSLFGHVSRFSAEIVIVDDCSPDATDRFLPLLPQIRYHRQARNGGFIASSNTGGAIATGRFVVMLNNDTRVVSGWLDALIGSFEIFPRAGLVGGKMLYPDGSLQEAGGIIWRDGRAWNYGRNDDPNRPEYCYARRVDYISGCSIALRRQRWDELGGFDAHFSPAYCEDADLCLRVAAAGEEVWYQPQARIVHYEGKTSGTDTGKGVKAYQVVNTGKLFLRWRNRLARHRRNGETPYLEKDRDAHTRILVVDATTPTPDQDAGSLQTVLTLHACRELGYRPHFVPEDNFLYQPRYTTSLLAAGIECAYAPYELGMDAYLRRYGALFDVVLVFRVTVLSKIMPLLRQHAPQAVVLYHVADLHFLRLERQAAVEADASLAAEAARVRAEELALVAQADCTITHSAAEAELLDKLAPGAPVQIWPLMFPLQGTSREFASRRDVVFLGGYGHAPNVDAVTYFCADIMPRLRAAEPGIRFIIAGANPTAEVRALAGPDVVVTGLVEELRDVLDEARVFVCPLRVGAGIKGKIMTALAYGIPVVTTSIGIEGSGIEPERDIVLADDAESFAAATLRLYRDPAAWARFSEAGQKFVAETVSPTRGAAFLDAAITRGFARRLRKEVA